MTTISKSEMKRIATLSPQKAVEMLEKLTQERDTLRLALEEAIKALEYYAHHEHYESRESMHGHTLPGVLVNAGYTARHTIAKLRGE